MSQRPRLHIDISPAAEVGYTQYGPTIGIAGTITAVGHAALVDNICVVLSKEKKEEPRFLDWFAFRPPHIVMGVSTEIDCRPPAKFTIAPDQAHPCNVLFSDNVRYSEMNPVIKAVKGEWEKAKTRAARVAGPDFNDQGLFAEFSKLKLVADAVGYFKKMSYWAEGNYNIRFKVTTENPKQIFDIPASFAMTSGDADQLSGNAAVIIADLCKQPHPGYHCATPSLSH